MFSVTCNFDHQAHDDPIVYHGIPGAAHLHQFFGATPVTASTTPNQLTGMATTCLNPGDHAAYWAPALVLRSSPTDATAFKPKSIFAYYQTSGGSPARAFPAGLVMVADASADPSGKSGFSCSDQGPFAPLPYDCPDKTVGHLHFPDCWDGVNLDSPNHRSHMSYSQGGKCDPGHPVLLVQLRIHVQYVGLRNGSQYQLALNNDGTSPAWHADFEMGWEPGVLERIMSQCINAGDMCKQDQTIGN